MEHLDHPSPLSPNQGGGGNGAFFPSRHFVIDLRWEGRGCGGFLFHVIPSEIVNLNILN